MPVLRRDDRNMIGMSPTLFVFLVMLGGGFLVLMCAAFHRFLGSRNDNDPQARTPEQDGYMREVRQRGYDELSYGRRPLREPVDNSQLQDSGRVYEPGATAPYLSIARSGPNAAQETRQAENRMQTPELIESLPHLNDQDVAILYDIACIAQQSHHRPIRALFNAYEQVLPQAGTDTDHDSKYFRFLSHAGTELAKSGTGGIVRRFRALLSRAGIQLVLEGGDDGSDAGISEVHGEGQVLDQQSPATRRRERRRASFNDSNLDTTWISGERLAGASGLLQAEREQDYRHQETSRRRRARSASIDHFRPDPTPPPPPEVWSESADVQQLEADAHDFYFTTAARRCLWVWQARTTQVHRRQQDLIQMATNHDKRTLLKQSLGQMRDTMSDNRFWMQQEKRASKARALFLLTKAFTHWAQAASDEVVKTSLAKRHILRTRYFNAWRDITAVNELKCRRIGLRKWFGLWRSRTKSVLSDKDLAAAFRRMHLQRTYYWRWFWKFCERKAPMWSEARLETRVVARWKQRHEQLLSMNLAAEGRHNMHQLRNTFASLRGRTQMVQDLEVIAVTFRRRSLPTAFLRLWRRNTTFKPTKQRAVLAKDARLVSRAFRIWWNTATMARIAREIDSRRVMANAWTAWNDRLRARSLQLKINDRVQLQTVYKWILEERLILFRRVMDHRQKFAALQRISANIAARQFQLQEATQLFHHNKNTRLLQQTMVKMHSQVKQHEHDDLAVLEFRNARLLPRILDRWKEQSTHARQLSRWASQARFYCLTSATIKKWKTAIIEAQRTRRREAYATIRRRQKMALAQRCLRSLHDRAFQMQTQQVQAQRVQVSKSRSAALVYLERWHTKTIQWQAEEHQAGNMISQYRRQDALSALILKLSELTDAQNQARAFEREVRERLASRTMRKLGDTLFLLRRQDDTAVAWKERKFTQHRREMIRYWSMKSQERRAIQIIGDPESPTKTPTLRAFTMSQRHGRTLPALPSLVRSTSGLDGTRRAEEWIQYEDLEQPDTVNESAISFGQTPLPGYLRTPSRRAARTRARFKSMPDQSVPTLARAGTPGHFDFGSSVIGSTTPAPLAPGGLEDMETLTPQVTPFQRKMRAGGYQNSTTPLTLPGGRDRVGFGISSRMPGTGRTVRFDEGAGDGESTTGSRTEESPSRGRD
ncbi:hypothetical protein B9Z65_9154 [Elsinoe australis]|uniref:Sfi1 spindle body domain-containing protein n=1 Tax=Elsinoe australis TaxID=40998 RepID=A0A2P7Z0P1_9PEZI|nr:hypothetical protein B9Z65_9154 [Elsinoe australis]